MASRIPYFKVLGILVTFFMLLYGCGQSGQKGEQQNQTGQTQQQSDKAPDQLTSMENDIEKVIKNFNGPALTVEEDETSKGEGTSNQESQDKKSSNKDQGQDKGQEDQGKQGGSSGQGGQQTSETQQAKPAQPQDPWEKASTVINDLQYKWNGYVPQSLKAGASRDLLDKFGNALNNLTNVVAAKDKANLMLAANSLYSYIPDFYSLYKTKTSPELKRVRYYVRNIMLSSDTANWKQADTDMNDLKASWAICKSTLSKDQQEDTAKLDFSIYELEKVEKEKNQVLVSVKGKVAMSNIGLLDKPEKSGGSSE